MPPTYVFLIDVSYRAVAAGILPTIADSIKDSLDRLPGGERTRIGFVTFDSSLHFYKLTPGASAPQMMVIATLSSPPLPSAPLNCLPVAVVILWWLLLSKDENCPAPPPLFSCGGSQALLASCPQIMVTAWVSFPCLHVTVLWLCWLLSLGR